MKKTLYLILLSSLISHPSSLLSATYTLIGERHLRKYTAPSPSQVYNAETDAQEIVNRLCYVDWTRSFERDAEATSHTESQLNDNVANRDKFDAALFCAYHTNGTHVAYANAAVYRYRLPDGQLPLLTSLSAYVSSDPYNTLGARIVLMTNSTGEIPTACATCRGDVSGGIKAAGVAPRVTRTVSGKNYWYPASSNVVFNASNGLSTGLQLQKYLFVFVLMENYATSRGNWIEGCSYIDNSVTISTSSPIPGWTDGDTVDLSRLTDQGAKSDDVSVIREDVIDKMAYYVQTNTVVVCTNQYGTVEYFTAPASAFRSIHRLDVNPSAVDHGAFRYADAFGLGVRTNLMSGTHVVLSVLSERPVAVMHNMVFMERGFESVPPVKDFTLDDKELTGIYLAATGLPGGDLDESGDTDCDGVPDGWELYVGKNPCDKSDAGDDDDGDGLSLVREYDHGYFPTNPFEKDTDSDGVIDLYALTYHLKGDDAAKDFDGDGLSNYTEYLVSEVFGFFKLDPDNPKTSMATVDRYRKIGNLYVGEVFEPRKGETNQGPSSVKMEIDSPKNTKAVVAACADGSDVPDASWTLDVRKGKHDYSLSNKGIEYGCFTPGDYTFFAYESADGAYNPGDLLGVSDKIGVGHVMCKVSSSLVKHSPISPRISVWTGSSDRNMTVYDLNKSMVNDKTIRKETNLVDFIDTRIDTSNPPEAGKPTRIRVVRYGIDDIFCYQAGVFTSNFNHQVVLDKTFYPGGRDFICESDFISATNAYDIDWGTLTGTDYTQGAVVDVNGNPLGSSTTGPLGAGCQVTNMTYLVVVGDGKKDFRGSYDTNVVRALPAVISRRFEAVRTRPTVDTTKKTFYSARPTFTWSMKGEDAWASEFGSTYTAFRLQITETDGTKVYDSGIVRAPKQDKDGNFVWTSPVCAGSLTLQGKVFEPLKTYKWKVSMYNAKFRSDYWSNVATFTMDVNQHKEVNDHAYSSIDAVVKYTGPSNAVEKYTDITTLKGKVRVQAFETADFSGEPLAETFVTNELETAENALRNATLVGLPAGGTYYVRAFIDMNGNGKLDAWESFGAVKTAVTLGTDVVAPTVGLFIEDADTDQDWLPDAWEYAYADWEDDFDDIKNLTSAKVASGRKIAVTAKLAENLRKAEQFAGLSTGLPGTSLTVFQNLVFAELMMGITDLSSFDAIRDAVKATVTENSLKVTSLTVADNKIVLTVDAEVSYEIAGMPLNAIYDTSVCGHVTLRLYKKNTILDANWVRIGTDVNKSFTIGDEIIIVTPSDFGINLNLTNGLYRVELVR